MNYAARSHLLGWMINRAVPVLNIFRRGLPWSTSLPDLAAYRPNSWGNSIHAFLSERGMTFLPKYEHHDALHVLLGYDTTVLGEARLQAFMVGNQTPTFAGRSLHRLAQWLLPEDRETLRSDRMRGSQSPGIDWLAVEPELDRNLEEVRKDWKIAPMAGNSPPRPSAPTPTLARLILLCSVAFFGFLVYSAGRGQLPEALSFYRHLPHGDTLGHFLLIGSLAFIATWATRAGTFALGKFRLPLGATVVFLVIVLEEFSQILVPARSFSFLDLAADFLGTLAFGWLALRLFRGRTSKSVANH